MAMTSVVFMYISHSNFEAIQICKQTLVPTCSSSPLTRIVPPPTQGAKIGSAQTPWLYFVFYVFTREHLTAFGGRFYEC